MDDGPLDAGDSISISANNVSKSRPEVGVIEELRRFMAKSKRSKQERNTIMEQVNGLEANLQKELSLIMDSTINDQRIISKAQMDRL